MTLSERLVSVGAYALSLTLWQFFGYPAYESWVLARGGVMGVGEVFVGYSMVLGAATVVSWIVIRRLKTPQ